MKQTPLKVGLFGAGRISQIHGHNIANHPELELIVVCLPRAESAESLRTFQTAGVVDAVLQHTTPQHIMRMVNGTGQVLANVAPGAQEFGWSRRNGFIKLAVDAELLNALDRFDHVDPVPVRWVRNPLTVRGHPPRLLTLTLAWHAPVAGPVSGPVGPVPRSVGLCGRAAPDGHRGVCWPSAISPAGDHPREVADRGVHDQHGTAIVVLAGLTNTQRVVGR